MKLKGILFFAASIAISVAISSCGPGTCVCHCNTASTKSVHNYNLGNITISDANGKCSALRTQYGWDTCMASKEMP